MDIVEMTATRILISLPQELALRLKAMIPDRQRSKVIQSLLESEIAKREAQLYKIALAVEKDEKLHREMQDWDVTIGDGLDNEPW
jgi:metal-responsive CopG/Arc/MetJ family transcriptional regulator